MAKKFWDGDVNMSTDWGGDATTDNLPLSGGKVQSFIKDSLNSKVGYIGEVKTTSGGFYVLCRDAEVFATYSETVTEDAPFGDLTLDGVIGRFDAPFNYTMSIEILEPEGGYKAALASSTGNIIRFKAETQDNSGAPQQEGVTVTYRIKNANGVESSQTIIYPYSQISAGVSYNLDGKISAGENTITITVVGENTGISSMRRITYNLLDIYFKDRFDISKRYSFDATGVLSIPIGYDLKGVGETTVYYYFDGNLVTGVTESNYNPSITNANKNFIFTSHDAWMTVGLHTLQMYMKCIDTESKEEFFTPIYYREFVVESTPTSLETPYITKRLEFDYSHGILAKGEIPTIYDVKQFENIAVEYAAYYNAKSQCNVETFIEYPGTDLMAESSENLDLVLDSFSTVKSQTITLLEQGPTVFYIRANYGDGEYFESLLNIEIGESAMNISTSDEGVVLYLNAFGRSNNASDKERWEYEYLDALGNTQVIDTEFSKNEYFLVSTKDSSGNVTAPSGAADDNTLEVDELPTVEQEDYDFVKYNGEWYAWNREFDWSNTSGWSDGKLKLSNGNMITINYKPFSEDKLATMKLQGGTFEFEFETTNVYDDDAVICRICGNNNFAPGITIYAAGAELVVSREIVTDESNENAGYAKMVSTKYKSEESNRISFVISPDIEGSRNKILSIYVNGEYCGAYAYDAGTNFYNDSKIQFRGGKDAGINLYSIKIYNRALSSTEILNNYIYYRNDSDEKQTIYERNDIVLATDSEQFDADKLKSMIPVMTFYQIFENEKIEDIHQEKKNKKLTRHFDVLYTDINNPSNNFFVKCAYITPQGTSSMNYPVKNFRLYTTKDDRTKLYVGSDIFLDGNPANRDESNLNPEALVKKGKYAFKEGSIPVKCWCLKADFAESSSSHNTGTSRYWNEVLKNGGLKTKAQAKAEKYADEYPYDVRTAIDGFPIVLFYERIGGTAPEFQGKYNFNNDKSTEDVFGFTGGIELENQEVKYFWIGNETPVIHSETDEETGEVEYACTFSEGGYTSTPDVDSPLYASKIEDDGTETWYMLRGKELLDNPKMECWELLNSVNELALFKTAKTFTTGDDDEKVGILVNGEFDEAFESRFPDCGDYYHTNSLRRFAEWLVSCRYLTIDSNTGKAIPFAQAALPVENYHLDADGNLIIQSLSKKTGTFTLDYPDYNFYTEVSYDSISSKITSDGYAVTEIDSAAMETIEAKEVEALPVEKDPDYEYLIYNGKYYTWQLSNLLVADAVPEVEQEMYDFVLVGDKYYVWKNYFNFSDYYEAQHVADTPFNRALKFAVEKYDHIEMDKMAAYYIYLMRFGGVDQTVKNSMLTTEGPATDDPESTLPSLWYFINYDNDTILGVKNDGRLVFDPYITRETKDGTGYVYAGRESTLWNNLEADIEFMDHVTEIDNKLTDATSNPLYSLSYANALREYDTNQSDKWCERIYNKDAETKYIKTYVEGWVQKIEADNSELHVYEDYLYDVQGSRSAHRKWWLGRRFNVYDSRFANANFRAQLIKFRSTNLPAGSSFTIRSGEPVYYAWGHDNVISEMTPNALPAGDTHTFTTASAFNIGSYLELMGAANISTFNLRNCVGALTELDITGCYSALVGTKMKELLVGDHTRTDLINNGTSMKFSGLDAATKLETLDVTNIRNIDKMDGLNKLLNIRNVYAKGCSAANFTFADGCMIKYLELPSTCETLSLTRSSMIRYEGIVSEDPTFAKLNNLTIDNCRSLMTDFDFVINWLATKSKRGELNQVNVNLQGIDWTFDETDYNKLFYFEGIGSGSLSSLNVRGNITINAYLQIEDINRLKAIFGNECFKEGSAVYIKAVTGLYIKTNDTLYEGDGDVNVEVTTVGTLLTGSLEVYGEVVENIDGVGTPRAIETTDGLITMDKTNLAKGSVTVNIKESDRDFTSLTIRAKYTDEKNDLNEGLNVPIKKRVYPTAVKVNSIKDSYSDDDPNILTLSFTPSLLDDVDVVGRGIFSTKWTLVSGSSGWNTSVILLDTDKEVAYVQAPNGFDGKVLIRATITSDYDGVERCYGEKEIEFKNPNTIITELSNPEIYQILVDAGIIIEDASGFGKLDISGAGNVSVEQLLTTDSLGNTRSIFYGHSEIKSFLEFQYFTNSLIGQEPIEGNDSLVIIPDEFFGGCSNMTEIAFSRNFYYTANNMFKGCSKLESVYGKQTGYDEEKNPVYDGVYFKHIGTGTFANCSKLKNLKLTNAAYIGANAFQNCSSLGEFSIPARSDLEIDITGTNNPFNGCSNITFLGAAFEESSLAAYQVKDGALYQVKDDVTTLVHMGKDTLMTQLVSDRDVYACSYAMEHRTESDPVVPSNIIFDGDRMFNGSAGNSITITRVLSDNCTRLFYNTNYGNNYFFADGETKVPSYCFASTNGLIDCTLPEGIVEIQSNAFYGAGPLQKVTLPSTLQSVGGNAFWLCGNLKTMVFNGMTPPSVYAGDFFNVMLDEIIVKPEAYAEFYENFYSLKESDNNIKIKLLTPFLVPSQLYSEGYVRIVKDGAYLTVDESNVVTVGGLEVVQENDYLKYVSDKANTNREITLNGEVVGYVRGQYTTIYLGDNSSLFEGDGYNFEIGIYDEDVKTAIESNGWFYDSRFEGLRSNPEITGDTTMSFDVSDLDLTSVALKMGQYSQDNNYYTTVSDGSGAELINLNGGNGLWQEFDLAMGSSPLQMKYTFKSSGICTGINGLVVNSIGNKVYSDPMIATMALSLDEDMNTSVKTVGVALVCDKEIPYGTRFELSDGKGHVYRKLYAGETMMFALPLNEFKFKAWPFITADGKYFEGVEGTIAADAEGEVEVMYETKTGVETFGNITCLETTDATYYIAALPSQGVWSSEVNEISDTVTEDAMLSEANGFVNSAAVLDAEPENVMFRTAREFDFGDESVVGYIPSYQELLIAGENIGIEIPTSWTSETADGEYAWASDGNKYKKTEVLPYYIFGRKVRI